MQLRQIEAYLSWKRQSCLTASVAGSSPAASINQIMWEPGNLSDKDVIGSLVRGVVTGGDADKEKETYERRGV